jgi:hypothetical protein
MPIAKRCRHDLVHSKVGIEQVLEFAARWDKDLFGRWPTTYDNVHAKEHKRLVSVWSSMRITESGQRSQCVFCLAVLGFSEANR